MTFDPSDKPILSLFPGAGLLDRAFEEAGFTVYRGPDLVTGGDIRRFAPQPGLFWAVIGGPPCQDFSSARRAPPTGQGLAMIREFVRCVELAEPECFLCENVPRVPDLVVNGFHTQRHDVNQKWFSDVTRLRHVQFGSRAGRMIHIDRGRRDARSHGAPLAAAAKASDNRPLGELLKLQGLPADFTLPGFTVEAAKVAVGNGVPLPMGRALVAAICEAYSRSSVTLQRRIDGGVEPAFLCPCRCGRQPTAGKTYYDDSCRKRAQRRRDRAVNRERAHA